MTWGLLDPGDAIQRMDWFLQDQWLSQRDAPGLHPDVVLVLEDDEAAQELGQTDARHRRARAIRQLGHVGARTVIIDYLLVDAGSDVSFYQDEAPYDGLPSQQTVMQILDRVYQHDDFHDTADDPELKRQSQRKRRLERLYTENSLQRRAFQELAHPPGQPPVNVVLATHFRTPIPSDAPFVRTAIDALMSTPGLSTTEELARASGVTKAKLGEHFERILADASHELVRRDRKTALEIAHVGTSLLSRNLQQSLDRSKPILQEALARSTAPGPGPPAATRWTGKDLVLPYWQYTEHVSLAYSDATPDEDAVIRQLRTSRVVRFQDGQEDGSPAVERRSFSHQALLASRMHAASQGLRADAQVGPSELTINWPIDGQRDWIDQWKVPQSEMTDDAPPPALVRLSDLLQLANVQRAIHMSTQEIALRAQRLATAIKAETPVTELLASYEAAVEAQIRGESLGDSFAVDRAQERLVQATRQWLVSSKIRDQLAGDQPVPQAWPSDLLRLVEDTHPALVEQKTKIVHALKQRLEGKLCLVGDMRTGSVDYHVTPVGRIPGIVINAAAASTLLSGNFLSEQTRTSACLTTVVVMTVAAFLFSRLGVVPATLSVFPVILLVGGIHWLFLESSQLITRPVLPVAGVVACFSAVTIRKWWHDNIARRKVRRAFEFYLHPAVVQRVSEQPEALQLGGAATELSILFSDIRGFTTIAERLQDDELTRLLNEYLTAMTEVVFEHNGTVDKYIGDAIMAFYGAPIESDTHALESCLTALHMSQRLATMRPMWRERGLPSMRIGLGINTDTVRVGNFGSDLRFDYTIIGDGVNLASRLEGATKQYGVEILISESTWDQVSEHLITRELDLIQVKGRQQPTRIFELVGEPTDNNELLERVESFESALKLYKEAEFETALRRFQELAELDPSDQPSQMYVDRCQSLIASPPQGQWSGVYVMSTK